MKESKIIKVLHVDDHPIVTDGVQLVLSGSEEISYISKVYDSAACLYFLEKTEVDIVLLDINLPDMDGLKLCKIIISQYPNVKVLFLSMIKEPSMVKKALKVGAKGYLLKSDGNSEIIKAIKVVAGGGIYHSEQVVSLIMSSHTLKSNHSNSILPLISRRERQILNLIVDEFTSPEIAKKLFVSPHTVDSHRKNLLMKFNVKNTAGLVRAALELGLLK